MVDAIVKEIQLQKHYLQPEPLDSIYFGGGTPSILSAEDLQRILDQTNTFFAISPNAEITLEANPDDLDPEFLTSLNDLGINRLSVGIQSFNDQVLKYINRAHDSQQAIASFENARKAGFGNLSLDLIFSIPGQTQEILSSDLRKALELSPEHISIYGLTIEQNTVFGNWENKGKLKQVEDNNAASQFELIMDSLDTNGYEQYEISNFCRNEMYAVHNSSYWKGSQYLGVGPGAHSFNGEDRQFNIEHNHHYMKAIEADRIPCTKEILDAKSKANDYILTSLRTKWGCSRNVLSDQFGYQLDATIISRFVKEGLLIEVEALLKLTKKGRLLADSIISELFWV